MLGNGNTMFSFSFCVILACLLHETSHLYIFKGSWSPYDEKYAYFSESDRLKTLEEVKEMFYFGYDNYMKFAYPQDELNPIYCSGRGPDYDNP